MLRRLACLFVVGGMLAGCAVLQSPLENPAVLDARRSARDALDQARELGVPDHRPQLYDGAEARFTRLSDTGERMGIDELIRGFNGVEITAHEGSIAVLRDRVDELDSTLSRDLRTARDTIEELRGSLARLRARHDTAQRRLAEAQQKLNRKNQNLQQLRQENREIAEKMQEAVKEAEVRRERRRVYLTLQSRILFDLGKAELKSGALQTLRKVAEVLNQYPERNVRVEGHTDDIPIAPEYRHRFPSNWELSTRRATNVVKYLVGEQAVAPDRLSAVGYGEYHPRVPNTSPENRQQNRRVEIVLMPREQPVKTLDPEDTAPESEATAPADTEG